MEVICPCCNLPCNATVIDMGIGGYEFWGAKGFDSRPVTVSDCCEAELDADTIELLEMAHCNY